jgi:Calcineurin-like phosphoesterase
VPEDQSLSRFTEEESMSERILVIGDIHGYLPALDAVLAAAAPGADDLVVTLGDYVDRGPDSRGVIERLIEVGQHCRLKPILGNHEEIVLNLADGDNTYYIEWLGYGGEQTLESYDCRHPKDFPPEHLAFLRGCLPYYETDDFIFLHASYLEDYPLEELSEQVLRWESLRNRIPGPHCSGRRAIVGHTAQHSGEILNRDWLTCIDTWVYGDGWLTLLDLSTGRIYQASGEGRLR